MLKDILNNVGDDLVKEIKNRMSSKRLNSSGGTSNSLKVKVTDDSLQIRGKESILFLNRGRYPGGRHPYNAQRKESYLLDWARRIVGNEKEARRFAFLVGRKLVREGSNIYKDPSKGLELKEVAELGKKKIFKYIIGDIKINIINKFKEV